MMLCSISYQSTYEQINCSYTDVVTHIIVYAIVIE